jgi:sulfite dehydrogenase
MKKILLCLVIACQYSLVQAKSIALPADTILWRPSALPGYQLALQKCSACHSAHYAEYQPPNTGAGYWNAQVLRMKNVFKAPITNEEVPILEEYLQKTYGANRK